jgi:hypothetical protein
MDADDLYKVQDPNAVFLSLPFLVPIVAAAIFILCVLMACAGKYGGAPNGNFLQRSLWMIYDGGLHCVNSIIQLTPNWVYTLRNSGRGDYRMNGVQIKAHWRRKMRAHHEDPRQKASE